MDFKDIKEIVELMDEFGLSQFKLEQDETKLELKRGGDLDIEAMRGLLASAPPTPAPAPPTPAASPAPAPAGASGDSETPPAGVEEILSPMVGTFYSAPEPTSDPFVKVGSQVEPETTVCIVEAMKVMNQINAERTGEIVKILVENGTAVQYGEPLFWVKVS